MMQTRREFIAGLIALGIAADIAEKLAFVERLGRSYPVGPRSLIDQTILGYIEVIGKNKRIPWRGENFVTLKAEGLAGAEWVRLVTTMAGNLQPAAFHRLHLPPPAVLDKPVTFTLPVGVTHRQKGGSRHGPRHDHD